MKILTLSFLLCSLTYATVFGQSNRITLSNNITTEEKSIIGFNKIEVDEDFDVIIRFSDKEAVKIEANENLHPLIVVKKVGNTLKISTKNYNTGKHGASERLTAYITAKEIISFEGSEDVTFELKNKLSAKEVYIKLEEDSQFEGELEVTNLIVDLDEDASLNLEGKTQYMKVNANEDSNINSYDFSVKELVIDLKSDSEVRLTVNETIDLRAGGDSKLFYKGKAKIIKKRIRGDSEVSHRE